MLPEQNKSDDHCAKKNMYASILYSIRGLIFKRILVESTANLYNARPFKITTQQTKWYI